MRKRTALTRVAALFMSAAIGLSMTGCNTGGQLDHDETILNATGIQAGGTEKNASGTEQRTNEENNGMGRYVEETVFEGNTFSAKVEAQTLRDGQIVFLNSLTYQKIVAKDETIWENEENWAFSAFVNTHYPAAAAIAKDGTIAVVGMDEKTDLPEGVLADYDYNLYIYNTDNTTEQIPVAMPDDESHLRTLAFDEQGTLYAFASGCGNIYKIDVAAGTSEKFLTLEDTCSLMQCKDNILMCVTRDKIFLYDLEEGCFMESETLDSFIEENFGEMEWTGAGYTTYAFLGTDNTIYVAGEKGLYRHVIGGSVVEQVIDGGLSSLGDPTYGIMSMAMNDKNEFFAAYSNGRIVKFTYNAAVSSVPGERITVYSLNEDDLVKHTIFAYQIQYPDMYIEYQTGMDEDGITREDALKKLNTQLLSGSGPDVIMLDGIDIDTYAEKGVLMDLSELVNEVNQEDGLYRNLIDSIKTDDKTYAVPARFYIPVINGNKDYVSDVNDCRTLADMAEKARRAYPDTSILGVCSATGIMKKLVPVCAPAWKDDKGQFDQGRIREFLEQSKRLYDVEMNGTPQEYIEEYQQNMIEADGTFLRISNGSYLMRETPFSYGEMDAYAYRDMQSFPRAKDLEDTVMKQLDGQGSNIYHPMTIAGINAATKNTDAAKQFVDIMLSEAVQENIQLGFPVNKEALSAQFAYDESDLDADGGLMYMSISTKDGVCVGYAVYPVEQEGIDKLEGWIAQLDTPYLSDTVLESAVCTEGAKYLEGMQDLDAAMKAIADSVEIYLYE